MTIVRLCSADRLLNYQLDWPDRQTIDHDAVSDFEVLEHIGLSANQIIGSLLGLEYSKQVVIPIFCSHDYDQGVLQWQSDLTEEQYHQLTALFAEFFPTIQANNSHQYWGLSDEGPEVLSDHLLRADSVTTRQQEIEMALYRHPINIEREGYQKKAITGVMVGTFSKSGGLPSNIYTNSSYLRHCGVTLTLDDWFNQFSASSVLILGEQTTDSQLQSIKEHCMYSLSRRYAYYIKVIQPNITERYSSTVIHRFFARYFK